MTHPRDLQAILDPSLSARITSRRALHYAAGASAALDRPAHVRAASAIVRVGRSLVVVQDDAAFLAVWSEGSAGVVDVPLPAGPDGIRLFGDDRGNKAAKLDLEAMVTFEHEGQLLVIAFGSGSTSARERVVVARVGERGALDPHLVHAPELYAVLRGTSAFSGSQLNLEGAYVDVDDIVLVQRGNGKTLGSRRPLDATIRIDRGGLARYLAGQGPLPELHDPVAFDLGCVSGGRLTFTDASPHDGSVVYVACAEDSPDTVRDGPVAGVAIGLLPRDGPPRYALLQDERGAPCTDKVEGLVSLGPGRLLGVVDRDDTTRAAELLEIAWSTE